MIILNNLRVLSIGIIVLAIGCSGDNVIAKSDMGKSKMEPSGIKFQVCKVDVDKTELPKYLYEKAIRLKTIDKIEAYPQGQDGLFPTANNAFVEAVRMSFNQHRPLSISPDMIWLLICQGFAEHVNNNSEELRHFFVDHKGKKKINVRRDTFVKGDPKNPWENVFPEFCDKINSYAKKDVQNLIIAEFSTTSLTDKTVFQISLMDSMQSYFSFQMTTLCGIPSIRLTGIKKDWESILNKVKAMKKYKLDWWTTPLIPVLEKFVEAFNNKIDRSFWASMYKYIPASGRSGSVPKINGWVLKFFPYLKGYGEFKIRNPFLSSIPDNLSGVKEKDFPSGLSVVPFIWQYYKVKYDMNFVGGFVGVGYKSGELFPKIGWFITEKRGAEN